MIDLSNCKTIEERTHKLTGEYADEFFQGICTSVSHGGSLIDVCKIYKVHFGRIVSWIRADREGKSRLYSEAINDRAEWTKERVLSELKSIGTINIREIVDKEGTLLPVDKWPDDFGRNVKTVEFDEDGYVRKISFWSKERSLDLLGKNIGMFTEKIEHSGTLSLEDIIEQSLDTKEGESPSDETNSQDN